MATRDELKSSFILFQKEHDFILEKANITHMKFFSWVEKSKSHRDDKLIDSFLFRGPDCFAAKVRTAKLCWDKNKDSINWNHALIFMKTHTEVKLLKELLNDIHIKWVTRPVKNNRGTE